MYVVDGRCCSLASYNFKHIAYSSTCVHLRYHFAEDEQKEEGAMETG